MKTILTETSTSRLLKHLTDDRCLAIISPYRTENSEQENQQKLKELKHTSKKYGFIEFISRWSEQSSTGETLNSDERSLMIFNISLDEAMSIGQQYNQSSIIYKNGGKCCEVCTTPFTSYDGVKFNYGDVVRIFSQSGNVLNLDVARDIFNGIKSGPSSYPVKGNRPFTLKEIVEVEQPHASYFQTKEAYK